MRSSLLCLALVACVQGPLIPAPEAPAVAHPSTAALGGIPGGGFVPPTKISTGGGGGITNTAPANDIAMSDGTNIVAFGGKSCISGWATAMAADGTLTCSSPTGLISGLTSGFLPKASSGTAIANSLAKDTGSQFSYNTNSFTVDTSGNAVFNGTLTADGASRVFDTAGTGLTSSTHTVTLNMAGASCSGGSFVSALNATGTGTCTSAGVPTVSGTSGDVAVFTGTNTVGNGAANDNGTTTTLNQFATSEISPSALSAEADNYNPSGLATTSAIGLDCANNYITGIQGGAANRHITIHNTSTVNHCYFADENNGIATNSSAANRIQVGNSTQLHYYDLPPRSRVNLVYNGTASRWVAEVGSTSFDTISVYVGTATGWTANALSIGAEIYAENSSLTTTGTVNDWALPSAIITNYVWVGTSTITVDGVYQYGQTGWHLKICNQSTTGGANMIFKYKNGGNSTASSKIDIPGASDVTLQSGQCLDMYASPNDGMWEVYSTTGLYAANFTSVHSTGGITSDSSGVSTGSGGLTVGAFASFSGGITGINGSTSGNTYYEWNDDWLLAPSTAASTTGVAFGSVWYLTQTGGSFKGVAGKGRPGIIEISQGTSTSGNIQIETSPTAVDFGVGNWTLDAIVGFPTLSTTSGTGDATALVGFFDGTSSISPTNGCYFLYDAANKATGGANSGLTQDLEAVCQTGGSRTVYLLNGSGNCDASFAKGTVTIAAVTWPSTHVYNLKVVMTGTSEADFYENNTKVCEITSNIPASGTTTAAGWNLVSEGTGSQTAVPMDIDFSSLSVTLSAARSP